MGKPDDYKDLFITTAGVSATLWALIIGVLALFTARIVDASYNLYKSVIVIIISVHELLFPPLLYSVIALAPLEVRTQLFPFVIGILWAPSVVTGAVCVLNFVEAWGKKDGVAWSAGVFAFVVALMFPYSLMVSAAYIGKNVETASLVIKLMSTGIIFTLAYAMLFAFLRPRSIDTASTSLRIPASPEARSSTEPPEPLVDSTASQRLEAPLTTEPPASS